MKVFKNTQSGRSMVEMLGVLAIIGVLSVGGITGYSKAMLKHKINSTLEKLSGAVARIVELSESNVNLNNLSFSAKTIVPTMRTLGFECEEPSDKSWTNRYQWYCSLPIGYYYLSDFANDGIGLYFILRDKNNAFDMCTAFFNSKLHNLIPDEWYTSHGGRICVEGINGGWSCIGGYGTNFDDLHEAISYGPIPEIDATTILEKCAVCKKYGCEIIWYMF